MTFREKGEPAYETSIPCTTVGSPDVAKSVQIVLCRLAYDGRYIMNDFGEFLGRANDVGAALEWAKKKIEGVVAQVELMETIQQKGATHASQHQETMVQK